MKTLTLTKEFINILKWTMKALYKLNDRHNLSCVSYHEGVISAADGFRIHMAQVETESDRNELIGIGTTSNFIPRLMGALGKKQSLLVAEESDTTFPNLTKALPDGMTQTFSFAINPRYLKEAIDAIPLRSKSSPVIVRYFGEGKPIVIETEQVLACIMPMMIPDKDRMKPHAFDSFLPLNKVAVKTEEPTSEKV